MERIREYLHLCMYSDYQVSPEMAEFVTNEFALMKQNYPKMSGQDLLNRLEYARLYSKSFGKHTLEREVWDRVMELDLKRCERLEQEHVLR